MLHRIALLALHVHRSQQLSFYPTSASLAADSSESHISLISQYPTAPANRYGMLLVICTFMFIVADGAVTFCFSGEVDLF